MRRHQLQPARVDEMARLLGERHVERDGVGSGEQVVQARLVAREPGVAPGVVEHGHAEAGGAPGDGLTDPAEADDPEGRAMDVVAEERVDPEAVPFARAQRRFGVGRSSRGRQQQEEGDVGGRLIEHARRVADRHAQTRGGGHVDVVVADADVADRFEPARSAREDGLVDGVGDRADERVEVAVAIGASAMAAWLSGSGERHTGS